ncbi:hypothetical protein [Merismopedia glauca]|uniref:PsbP C-terminal domain-containing protein n=1 Tax=Merismopedia glauca CCAP 1448/3 TaxID=1296344 RepID=A0A2T1C542_9CYAN|nr:hypothetical protein [Merismopedia glauca]PSB03344.1 hypothetical protein C7B64_08795 [Merismopedia glauca CCAP 1448/3]
MNYLTTKKLIAVLALIGLTLGGCSQSGETGKTSSPAPTTSTPVASNSTPSTTPSTETSTSATPSTTPPTEATTSTTPASGNAYVSENGEIQVNLPSGWSKATGLNAKAELQVSNPSRDMYLIVLSESKEDFEKAGQEVNLQKHSDITKGILLKSLKNAQTNGPKSLTVNGNPALQDEISGVTSNLKVVYLHTTVETDDNYHQILAYTSQDDFAKNRSEIEEVINSFQEVE